MVSRLEIQSKVLKYNQYENGPLETNLKILA